MPLQRSRRRELTARQLPGRAPRRFTDCSARTGIASAGPTPPATVPLTGFPNLAAASLSLRRPAIFRQVALLGFGPTGGCSCHAAPTARRRRHALLALFPSVGLPPVLGGGTSGRTGRFLGSGLCLLSPSGPSSAWESVGLAKTRLASRQSTCPSWAFASPWPDPSKQAGLAPRDRRASRTGVRRRITGALRSTACRSPERDLSHERTQPSRGSSPSLPLP